MGEAQSAEHVTNKSITFQDVSTMVIKKLYLNTVWWKVILFPTKLGFHFLTSRIKTCIGNTFNSCFQSHIFRMIGLMFTVMYTDYTVENGTDSQNCAVWKLKTFIMYKQSTKVLFRKQFHCTEIGWNSNHLCCWV